jgi:uncharacterized integral membrane protein
MKRPNGGQHGALSPYAWALLVLASLVLLFVVQNTQVVEVRFLFWTWAMSRVFMFLLLFGLGLAAGWLLHRRLGRRPHQRHTDLGNQEGGR